MHVITYFIKESDVKKSVVEPYSYIFIGNI